MSVEQQEVQQDVQQSPGTQPESQQLDLLQPEGEQTEEQTPEQQEESDEQKAARLVKEVQIRQRREANKQAAERRVLEKERDTYRALVEKSLAREERQAPPQEPRSSEPTRDYNPATGQPYATYDEFIEDRASWKADQRFEARMQQSLQHVAEQQQRQTVERQEQAHSRRMSEFAQQVPDFEELAARDDVEIPRAAGHIIKRMANGPALIMAMAQRPELADNLKRMETPVEMATYLGQLSQWISSHRSSQVSNAAPSGRTVGAKPASASTPPDDPDDYERWANKKFGRR